MQVLVELCQLLEHCILECSVACLVFLSLVELSLDAALNDLNKALECELLLNRLLNSSVLEELDDVEEFLFQRLNFSVFCL